MNINNTILQHSCNKNVNNLHKNISKLRLEKNNTRSVSKFNKHINNLPCMLIELILNNISNKKINNLPNSIEKIEFYRYSIINISKHPHNLKYILFSDYMTDIKINILPYNMFKIQFEEFYDKKYNNLPLNLSKIINHRYFNQQINNLPLKINTIHLMEYFNKSINNLPNMIKYLIINTYYYNKKINKLPTKLYHLEKSCMINYNLYNTQLQSLSWWSTIEINNLPITLKKLKIFDYYTKSLDFLNEGLKTLILKNYKFQVNDLPSSIKKIYTIKKHKNLINKIYHNKIKLI